jgi:hypothetical protein
MSKLQRLPACIGQLPCAPLEEFPQKRGNASDSVDHPSDAHLSTAQMLALFESFYIPIALDFGARVEDVAFDFTILVRLSIFLDNAPSLNLVRTKLTAGERSSRR